MNIDLKDVAYDLYNEEKNKLSIDCEFYPLTSKEYYNSFFWDRDYSFCTKCFYFFLPIIFSRFDGFHDSSGRIVILIDKFKKSYLSKTEFINFLVACYHEFRHDQQDFFDSFGLDKFLHDMEKFMRIYSFKGRKNYWSNHNNFSYEIGANLYGVRKTREYLIKNYPDIYKDKKNYIDKMENDYEINYYDYNVKDVFDNFIISLRKSKYNDDLEIISPVLPVFLNDNYCFRKVSDIFNDDKFNDIDYAIKAFIFTSNTFVNEVNFNSLSNNELSFVRECFGYTSGVNINKNDMKKKILLREYEKK